MQKAPPELPSDDLRRDVGLLRQEYAQGLLGEESALADPFLQFERWFDEALAAGLVEPNAMTLATVGADGRPSARTVLLKSFDRKGFAFFTNYESRKGRELAANPCACLLFWWDKLQRQVRIDGRTEKVSAEESDVYFASRPHGSRIGALASPQSRPIDREALAARFAELEAAYPEEVPRPAHWGGYRLIPDAFEFWQGRPSRLHDRLRYRPAGSAAAEGGWRIERLAP